MTQRSIADIEFHIKNSIVDASVTSRPVRFSGERTKTPDSPYMYFRFISAVRVGKPYEFYWLDDQTQEMKRTRVLPNEIVFSFVFVGGNAMGDLSLFLLEFAKSELAYKLADHGIGFLRSGSIINLSSGVSGDWMRRASCDIAFSANLATTDTIETIETVEADIKTYDHQGDLVLEKTINMG